MPHAGRDGVVRRRERALERLIHLGDEAAVVRAWAAGPCVRLRAESASRAAAGYAVERMRFALGRGPRPVAQFQREFKWHPLLGPIIRRKPWLRPRRRAEPWEALAWAITEQLIESERAARIQRRLVYRYGRLELVRHAARRAVGRRPGRAARRRSSRPATSPASARSRMIRVAREVAAGRADLREHEPAWKRLLSIREIGTWTVDKLAYEGQGRDDMLPAGDLAYVKLVGRLARLGRRATEDEVREFFEPFAPFQGLAGTYLLLGR